MSAVNTPLPITVVVPTYRRPDMLRRCLNALEQQDLSGDQFEVIVVDDGSGDDFDYSTVAPPRPRFTLKWLKQPENRGPAAARNRGVSESRGRIILFLDDDIAPSPTLVRTHLEYHYGRDRLLGVVGRVDWHPDLTVTPFMRWLDSTGLQFAFDAWMREGPIDEPWRALYSCNLSMAAEVLKEVGGFDERFPYPAFEDIELGVRLDKVGFHLEYRPEALAWNIRSLSLQSFCDRTEFVAKSAALLRQAQPDMPFELPEVNQVRRFERTKTIGLPVLRGLAAVVPNKKVRGRYYWAELSAAYRRGARTVEAPKGSSA